MDTNNIKPGDKLVCAETGKEFIAENVGNTTNYARDSAGNVYSDEGVEIRESKALLARKPFTCYISSDGNNVTGWKGNKLGTITQYVESRTGWHGSTIAHIRVTDIHGGYWHAKGRGKGMVVVLRPARFPN